MLPLKSLTILFLILSLIVFSSCSDQLTVEEQIKQYVKSAASYAESRNLRKLKKLVSENYTDTTGRTQRDITAILAGYFMRNSSFHLLTRMEDMVLNDDRNATATVLVAISAGPISMGDIELAQAIFHAFEIQLVKESDDWQLSSAKWQPSNIDTFLSAP